MEWILQLIDEMDDALCEARFCLGMFVEEMGLAGCALIAGAAIGTATALGSPALVLSGALGTLGAAALLKAGHYLHPAGRARSARAPATAHI